MVGQNSCPQLDPSSWHVDSDMQAPSHIINVNTIFKVKKIILTLLRINKKTTWIKYLPQKYEIHNFYVSSLEVLTGWGRPSSKEDVCLALPQ